LRSQRGGREFEPPAVHQPPLTCDQAEVVHQSGKAAKVDLLLTV